MPQYGAVKRGETVLKRRRSFVLLILLACTLFAVGGIAYYNTRLSQGVEFAMSLGPGWNLANTLDTYGLGRDAGEPAVYETYWGSAPASPAQINAIAQAGFKTLRIPVTWFEHMDDQNRIDPVWMARVQAVVDDALAAGMNVILNAHHDPWYMPDVATLDNALATMRAVWQQIASHFAQYDSRLLFESMNEPRLLNHPEEWTAGTAEARACVNRLNAVFVETVRNSGGQNATRYLLVPAYAASVQAEALSELELPDDDRLMVSAHLYAPYDFALNAEGTGTWSPTSEKDTVEIRTAIEQLYRRFTMKGIPVVLTEFGALDKQNEAARTAWATYVTQAAHNAHIPCFWWDTSFMDKVTHEIRYPNLLTALTRY